MFDAFTVYSIVSCWVNHMLQIQFYLNFVFPCKGKMLENIHSSSKSALVEPASDPFPMLLNPVANSQFPNFLIYQQHLAQSPCSTHLDILFFTWFSRHTLLVYPPILLVPISPSPWLVESPSHFPSPFPLTLPLNVGVAPQSAQCP